MIWFDKNLLGQGCELQLCVSTAGPSDAQFFPPFSGSGCVQVLVLSWIPVPQVAEHFDHALQEV